jgi:hypothetical protein
VADGRGTSARPAQADARVRARRAATTARGTTTPRRARRETAARSGERGVERRQRAGSRRRGRPSLRLPGLRVPSWLLPLGVLVAVGFLYVRPISAYLETRDQLSDRRAEVAALRAERARVGARLERATSLEELARAARKIGYVRPEEHLFIVKGTAAWARRHSG